MPVVSRVRVSSSTCVPEITREPVAGELVAVTGAVAALLSDSLVPLAST